MAQTSETEQGLGRFLSCGARKPNLEGPTDYCGLRTTNLFHHI